MGFRISRQGFIHRDAILQKCKIRQGKRINGSTDFGNAHLFQDFDGLFTATG